MSPTDHVILHGSLRPAKAIAVRVGDVDPSERIEVTLDLRGPELPGADALPKKALTRDQLEAKYGADKKDANHVSLLREPQRTGNGVWAILLAGRTGSTTSGCQSPRSMRCCFRLKTEIPVYSHQADRLGHPPERAF